MFIFFRYVDFLRQTRAAVTIQCNVRMWLERKRYLQKRSAAIAIQSMLRAHMAKQQYYKVFKLHPKKNYDLFDIIC